MGAISSRTRALASASRSSVSSFPASSFSIFSASIGVGPTEPKTIRYSLPSRARIPRLDWARSSPR